MSKKVKTKVKYDWKQAVAIGTAALATSGVFWWIKSPSGGNLFQVPAYRAVRVFDGDTFETTDKLRIRLMGVDAPEMGRCNSQEAKEKLEELILGKNLYIRTKIFDGGRRFVSFVYTEDGWVDEKMAESGLTMNNNKVTGAMDDALEKAFEKAKSKKIGIYSEKCTQTVNKENLKCVIKGNISARYKTKFYYFPGCSNYDRAIVQLAAGDQWFCSENEAIKAGFEKAGSCFGKSWK